MLVSDKRKTKLSNSSECSLLNVDCRGCFFSHIANMHLEYLAADLRTYMDLLPKRIHNLYFGQIWLSIHMSLKWRGCNFK